MSESLEDYQGEPQPPDGEALDRPVFADGKAATHPYGVLYQGEHETLWDGTCQAVRLHAQALATTGVPLLLTSFSNVVIDENGIAEPVHTVGLSEEVTRQVGALRNESIATLLPLIKHLVVRSAEQLKMVIYPRGIVSQDIEQLIRMRAAVAAATILYTVWERDRIDPAIVAQLSRVGECWVPCEQNAQLLRSAGVEQVRVMPHPYDPASPLCKLTGRRPIADRLFYSIGAWQPRKGLHELLGAFLSMYGPGDRSRLTLKISGGQWPGYLTPQESVTFWLADPNVQRQGWTAETLAGHLRVITARLPTDQILKLHFQNNIYVSAAHGEAWCLPAFDAKVAGNRVVHVPFGGTADFCEPTDVAVPFTMGLVDPTYGWEPEARWASYLPEELERALLWAEPPRSFTRSPGFEERFRVDKVGQLMLEAVLDVAERFKPEAAAYLRSQARVRSD